MAASQASSASVSNIVQHLYRQISTVNDLFEQQRSSLSKLEQAWIQNAIEYSTKTLSTYRAQCEVPKNDRPIHRRLQSLHAFTSNDRKTQSQEMMWNSQFLIAMQNLDSVMNMLSRSIHNTSSSKQTINPPPSSRICDLSSNELSRFLNRRRFTSNGAVQASHQTTNTIQSDIEHTIAELRATNSLLRTTNRSPHGPHTTEAYANELPLSLFETVELWRQNAEDALKAAMVRYFEQEELMQEAVDHETSMNTILGSSVAIKDAREITGGLGLSSSTHGAMNFQHTSTASPDMMFNEATAESRFSSSPIVRRKPVGGSSQPTDSPVLSPATPQAARSSPSQYHSLTSPNQPNSLVQQNLSPSATESPGPRNNLRLAPTNESTASAPPPLLSPFISMHGNARTSAVSLISTDSPDIRATSFEFHTDSAISVTTPFINEVQDIPHWQQPEAKSGAALHRKSKGRIWLEKQAGFGDE